jgi:hypothetical protein
MTSEILCPRALCDRDLLAALEYGATYFLTGIRPPSSIGRSRCWSLNFRKRNAARYSVRNIPEHRNLTRVTFQRRSNVRCGGVIAAAAHFRESRGAARKLAFWNSITLCRSRTVVRRQWPTFSCAVAVIINMRPIYGLASCDRRTPEKRAPSLAYESNSIRPERAIGAAVLTSAPRSAIFPSHTQQLNGRDSRIGDHKT